MTDSNEAQTAPADLPNPSISTSPQPSEPPPAQASKKESKQKQPNLLGLDGTVDTGPPGETPVERKKRQKAEKQARRERERAEREGGEGAGGAEAPSTAGNTGVSQTPKQQRPQQQQQQQQQGKGGAAQKAMPLRRRMSSGQVPILPQQKKEGRRETREKEKEVGLFGHLYGQPRRHEIAGAPKDIHPAILALGLQTSGYVVSGSNARCVAMLLAFKSLISSYTTPHGTSLARHLTTHLSPQIDYLKSCRPISIAMGNSIRWLKDIIIKIDPAVPESDAKTHLLTSIDAFIRDRITAADTLIAQTAASKIVDGDVILTFARSSIVQKTLLFAHAKGTKFRVLVVDSKPLFEGKRLAKRLADAGVEVRYALITGAAHAAKEATKCFLGAHAMMSNGRLYSRVGTAIVAMLAHERDVPVIVCCEALKMTDRVALDSIVVNEVAPADELLDFTSQFGGREIGVVEKEEEGEEGMTQREKLVKRWVNTPRLQMLNLLYDVTPAEYIRMIVSEYGSLPPSSVPVVYRISTGVQ